MHPIPKLSVIIPVYNTGQFLSDCIDSILGQNSTNLEIILIDDGSTDKCPEIIKKYTSRHPNITALHQQNQGQGVARNLGLSIAQGEYIAFVDSDDIIPDTAYEEMLSLAAEQQSDMVVGIQQSFNDKRTWRNVPVHRKYFTDTILRTNIDESAYLLGDISCCNRIIRHEIIREHSLRFPAASREDLDFTVRAYLHSNIISILPRIVYHYRGRPHSDTATIKLEYFQDWIDIIHGLQPHFKTSGHDYIYTILLCSEMQKLVVQSRFHQILNNTTYPERRKILILLGTLAQLLNKQEITENGMFSLREQVRVFMLQQEEYECLEIFEKKPWSPGYLTFLQNKKSYQKVSEPLLRIYMQKISVLNRDRKLNIRVRFPGLLKAYEHVSKPHRIWRQALQRRRKANIPLPALFFYFALYPLVWIQKKISGNKKVWLIDERLSSSAEDNGFFLFQHLREQHPKLKVFYVITPRSPDRERLEKLGQVIHQYSVVHAYYLLHAVTLLSTDSLRSLAYPAEVFRRLWKRTHNVFLQHGVTAVKRTIYTRKNYFYLSQIITCSDQEKEIFIRDYHFSRNKISVTGFARFDHLRPLKNSSKNKQVLILPTWRIGMKTPNQLRVSKFYSAWMQLLNSPTLLHLLEKHHASVYFRPHQNMLSCISDFDVVSDRIHIQQDSSPPLFKLIEESSLLITDYSSIMFDFFYQQKPTICYMFDRKEIEYSQGGKPHIDIDRELPADIHDTPEKVIASLAEYLDNNFNLSAKHKRRTELFFAYRDNRNCERIFQAVQQTLSRNQQNITTNKKVAG